MSTHHVRPRVAVVVALALTALVGATNTAVGTPHASRDPFTGVDTALRRRMRHDGLAAGGVLVVHDAVVLHRRTFGRLRGSTLLPIASASKWLTAATLMTLVDQGRLSLDDRVARFLPDFAGAKAAVTVRQLLSHTSGLSAPECIGDPTTSLSVCVHAIATGPGPASTPGREFHYSNVGFQVAGRLIEVLTGMSFEHAFERHLGRPVGMHHTRFDDVDGRTTRNPTPAASAVSSLDEYARFLDMIEHCGTFDGRRVLSGASVAEIERDQVAGLDTRTDAAVQITKVPSYGLGVWRDVTGPGDATDIVSGSGAFGFYPWVDRVHQTYGIVAVADLAHGPEHAVPASQRIARREWTAAAPLSPGRTAPTPCPR